MLTLPDPWLEPYRSYLQQRYDSVEHCRRRLTAADPMSLSDFANGHRYFGLQHTAEGWTFREWAPNATELFLVGDFNQWQPLDNYRATRIDDNGVWQLTLPNEALTHGQHYKMLVRWPGGEGLRIPAWCRRVVQDAGTLQFSAQVWDHTEPYIWQHPTPQPTHEPLLIYEAHIGMAQEEERIGTYNEFRDVVLPRIVQAGYNTLQLMAIQEHPYYGSFGYHVSSLFAPSSRFGTPEELKALIDTAHGMGLRVVMDIVHSHAVKNTDEGLGLLAGDTTQYFHAPPRGLHPAWDSLCYDYGKPSVLHFLLSNCKYWAEEFRFDGFRFDGVTSMLYLSHGLGEDFTSYDDYFSANSDLDAWNYLALANQLLHELQPSFITIAEEVSGMPMLTSPVDEGGAGFNYRMAMNIPDFWIRQVKEMPDEQWHMADIYRQLTNHRPEEHTISYVESHDQALVGDKTLIHRLADADLYWHFSRDNRTIAVDRALALHKMIRLATFTTLNGGYLNFMGNEFGHPEWIDFPREGNSWSHHFARRQWHLADDDNLCYHFLLLFDRDMIHLVSRQEPTDQSCQPASRSNRGSSRMLPCHSNAPSPFSSQPQLVCDHDDDHVLAFMRGDYLFVFNFHPQQSYTDYGLYVPSGTYRIILDTDHADYGGQGRNDDTLTHITISVPASSFKIEEEAHAREEIPASLPMPTPVIHPQPVGQLPPAAVPQQQPLLRLYLPARTALVLYRDNND